MKELMKRAVILFPRADYLSAETVRHNRRRYIQSVAYLRCRPDGSKWILDQRVNRVQ